MRTLLFCAAAGLCVGCLRPDGPAPEPTAGTAAPATDATGPTPTRAKTAPTAAGPPVAVYYTTIIDAYQANPVAADSLYLNKRVRTAITVEEIGRKDGQPYVGGTNVTARAPANFICLVADPADPKLLALKPGQSVTVEGVCEGMVTDHIDRRIPGLGFHVRLTGCRILEVAAGFESLKLAPPFPGGK